MEFVRVLFSTHSPSVALRRQLPPGGSLMLVPFGGPNIVRPAEETQKASLLAREAFSFFCLSFLSVLFSAALEAVDQNHRRHRDRCRGKQRRRPGENQRPYGLSRLWLRIGFGLGFGLGFRLCLGLGFKLGFKLGVGICLNLGLGLCVRVGAGFSHPFLPLPYHSHSSSKS